MKNERNLALSIGIICLAVALLMVEFLPANNFLNFFEGVFIGLSIALNFYYMFTVSRKNKK
jgi:hypothetical protein